MNKKTPTLQDVMSTMQLGFARIDEKFERIDERFERIDERFERIDSRIDDLIEKNDRSFNKIWANQVEMSKKIDVIYDQVIQHTENQKAQEKINHAFRAQLGNHDTRLKVLEVGI